VKLILQPRAQQIRIVLLVVILIFGLAAVSRANQPTASTYDVKLPTSVLFQVRDDSSRAIHSVLVLNKGQSWVWLDSQTMVESRSGYLSVAESAVGLNVSNPADWFSATYNLEIAENWILDRSAITALVDLVGGVEVTPDADISLALGESPVMFVKANEKIRLSGLAASIYATSSESKPDRLKEVLVGIFQKLDAAYLETVLPSIGAASRSTMGLPELIRWLETAQLLWVTNEIDFQELSVKSAFMDSQWIYPLSDESLAELADLGMPKSKS
jgi:hypothetical protein